MNISKAVITAAGRGLRLYPATDSVQKAMLPIVDRDGLAKPIIQIIAEEALASGIEEICIVCAPGDEEQYLRQFKALRENLLSAYKEVDWAQEQAQRIDNLLHRWHFAVQHEPLGYGHAVSCAQQFIGSDPFLLLLGDYVYMSKDPQQRCADQVISLAAREDCPVAAVHATREHLIGDYGTLTGQHVPGLSGTYQIERIIEKPSLTQAEIELLTPGLRVGHYLCFFGMHVLTPTIFSILEEQMVADSESTARYQLTPALQKLALTERYLALEVQGKRYDVGRKFGWLQAQFALGLAGVDHDLLLTGTTEVLLEAQQYYVRRQGD